VATVSAAQIAQSNTQAFQRRLVHIGYIIAASRMKCGLLWRRRELFVVYGNHWIGPRCPTRYWFGQLAFRPTGDRGKFSSSAARLKRLGWEEAELNRHSQIAGRQTSHFRCSLCISAPVDFR
jgi:hypothetical protein